jgi:hypothetical protein
MATNQHATTKELLEYVSCGLRRHRLNRPLQQQLNNNKRDVFSTVVRAEELKGR